MTWQVGKCNGADVRVLVRRSDPLGRILAGCETHRTKALIKRSGNVEETHAYGITNVTTPAALRRRS